MVNDNDHHISWTRLASCWCSRWYVIWMINAWRERLNENSKFSKIQMHRFFISCGASFHSATILVTEFEYEYDCLSLSLSAPNTSTLRTQIEQMAKWYVLLSNRHSVICLFIHFVLLAVIFFLYCLIRNDLIWRKLGVDSGLVNRWLNFMQRLLLSSVSFHFKIFAPFTPWLEVEFTVHNINPGWS